MCYSRAGNRGETGRHHYLPGVAVSYEMQEARVFMPTMRTGPKKRSKASLTGGKLYH